MQISHLRNEKDLVREKLETELKFLKNQINPHFLFNTLNNIYGLARKKSDKAPEVVMRLSKLLRFMLYESDRRTMPISDEIRVLEDYVQLEKIRFNDRLNLSFKQNIDDFDQVITPLILLPFIENAFKHGICETTESTQISIDISVKNGHLNFLIQNSHDKEQTQVHEKIGLSNVRRQLELMYREFSLNIENLAGTFNVNLWINLNSHAAI
nr:histidine kinase [Hufsiella arboris]